MAGGPPMRPPMPPGGGAPMPGGGAAPQMPPGGAPGGMGAGGGGIQQLMGLLGGAGGANPIAAVIQKLMSDPNAIKGMMNFMQGMSPTAGMPVPPSRGGPLPGGPAETQIPPTQGPRGAQAPPPGPGGPPPDAAEKMAADQIDQAGNTWDGVDAPTKGDIARLVANPTPAAIKSFDDQFGKGMAEKYIEDSGGGDGDGQDAEDQADQGKDESEESDY